MIEEQSEYPARRHQQEMPAIGAIMRPVAQDSKFKFIRKRKIHECTGPDLNTRWPPRDEADQLALPNPLQRLVHLWGEG